MMRAAKQKLVRLLKSRPNEAKGTLIGAAAGLPIGLMVGGVGIVAMGGAVGIPAALIAGVVGGAVGNRIGVEKDIPARSTKDQADK